MCGLMRVSTRLCAVLPILATVLAAAGCEGNSAALPEPDPVTQLLNVYTGPLDPNGRNNYLITLDGPANVEVTLAGALVDNPLRSVSPVLNVEIGTWDGSGCVVLEQAETEPRFSAVVRRYMLAGTHCVGVSDKRGMAQQVGVVLRVDSPPVLRVSGTPGTENFSSTITVQGRVSRSFDVSESGNASVSVASVSPSNAMVGVGIGVFDLNGAGCIISRTSTARPGDPPFTVPVAPGFYCAALYDIGNFTSNQTFSLNVTHP